MIFQHVSNSICFFSHLIFYSDIEIAVTENARQWYTNNLTQEEGSCKSYVVILECQRFNPANCWELSPLIDLHIMYKYRGTCILQCMLHWIRTGVLNLVVMKSFQGPPPLCTSYTVKWERPSYILARKNRDSGSYSLKSLRATRLDHHFQE